MRFIKTVIFALLIFCISTQANAKTFNAKTTKLANGLEVVVIPNHRAPVVTHMIWYKIGAADEPQGKSGITHFFEHLMFKGTEKYPDGEFSKIIKKLGGDENAFTSQDYTAYYQNVPRDHLEKMMEMEADRMRHLRLTEEDIKSERQVILEERSQRIDNRPQALFQEKLMSTIFTNHPYGTPVIGWRNEIEQLSREDALKTYKEWYAPNNAILIISGDINLEEALPLAKKYYGVLEPSKNIPEIRTRKEMFFLKENKRISMSDPKVGQPLLRRLYNAPRDNQALEAGTYILGGSSSSYLYKRLVLDKKKAIAISAGYNAVSLDDTTLIINAIPTPNTSLEELETEIDLALKEFGEHGITEEELVTAKKTMLADFIYYLDSLQGPAIYFGRHLTSGYKVEDLESMRETIQNISLTGVNGMLEEILTKQSHVTGTLTPAAQEVFNNE